MAPPARGPERASAPSRRPWSLALEPLEPLEPWEPLEPPRSVRPGLQACEARAAERRARARRSERAAERRRGCAGQVKTVREKWRLLPAFLKLRGLTKQVGPRPAPQRRGARPGPA